MTHERDPRRSPTTPSGSGQFPGHPHAAAARNGIEGAIGQAPDLGGPRASDYDALADLFLGESDGSSPVRRRPHPAPAPSPAYRDADARTHPTPAPLLPARIEGLIIGHLPVLASAWVTQYARHLAEQTDAWIGLVKVRAGQVSVELVAPAAPPAHGTPVAVPPPSARETLDAALAEGARVARHWLIRVDELAEARLSELSGLDALTLLTGADEAAVVASYRTLKLLGENADGDAPSRLGVAIMGATPDTARDAAARLARTVQVHLGVNLPLNACVPRIGAGRSVTIFRGELAGGTEAALPGIVGAIRSSPGAPAPVIAPSPEPAWGGPPGHPESAPDARAASPRIPPEPEAPAAMPPAPSSASRLVAPVWAEPADGLSAPAPMPSAPPRARNVAPSPPMLAAHLQGLRTLPARCPIAPAVEIALDPRGGVHLLADCEATNPGALEQLIAASGWAALNRDWVVLAAGGGSLVPSPPGAPVLHVFTSDARNARRLLDADVRVHLLVRVNVAGQEVSVCRPLN